MTRVANRVVSLERNMTYDSTRHQSTERSMQTTTITITKPDLEAALRAWELEHRAGETRTYEETCALPVEQVVAENTDHLWVRLGG
jgi:hypothetical protein